MSIELMLAAVNINLVAFGAFRGGKEAAIGQVFASFVLACGAVLGWISQIRHFEANTTFEKLTGGAVVHSTTWFQNNGFKIEAGIQIDGLAVMMMFVVTLISLLVHVYSTEYMR